MQLYLTNRERSCLSRQHPSIERDPASVDTSQERERSCYSGRQSELPRAALFLLATVAGWGDGRNRRGNAPEPPRRAPTLGIPQSNKATLLSEKPKNQLNFTFSRGIISADKITFKIQKGEPVIRQINL